MHGVCSIVNFNILGMRLGVRSMLHYTIQHLVGEAWSTDPRNMLHWSMEHAACSIMVNFMILEIRLGAWSTEHAPWHTLTFCL